MARAVKRNAEYFPHMLPGKTMKYIRKKYGNDGYAVWFILLEQLTDADDHHIICDEFQLTLLADECGVSSALLVEIIDDLSNLGKFLPELWFESRVLYSEELRNSIEDAYRKRKNECVTTEAILAKFRKKAPEIQNTDVKPAPETQEKGAGNTQSKVKKSKVKKSVFIPPPIEDVKTYFSDNGYTEESAVKAFDYYTEGDWHDSEGKKVMNWKQKMRGVWFKPENQKAPPGLPQTQGPKQQYISLDQNGNPVYTRR